MSEATARETRSAIVDALQDADEVRARLGSDGVRRLAAAVQALSEDDPRLLRLTVVSGEIWAKRTVGRPPMVVSAEGLLKIFKESTAADQRDASG